MADPSLQCFACGNRYDHLGDNPHPGVCTACGLRAVSFAGDVTVSAAHTGEALGQDDMLEVYLQDATDRVFTFYLTLDETNAVASLYVARFEDTRLTPQSPHWSADLVPESLREFVENPDGLDMMLCLPNTDETSDSDSDSRRGRMD